MNKIVANNLLGLFVAFPLMVGFKSGWQSVPGFSGWWYTDGMLLYAAFVCALLALTAPVIVLVLGKVWWDTWVQHQADLAKQDSKTN